jgi:hypothetical protein
MTRLTFQIRLAHLVRSARDNAPARKTVVTDRGLRFLLGRVPESTRERNGTQCLAVHRDRADGSDAVLHRCLVASLGGRRSWIRCLGFARSSREPRST